MDPAADGVGGVAMTVKLQWETPPEVSLLSLALRRGRRLGPGETLPAIEATATRLDGDAAAYAKVCGFPVADPLPVTWPAVLTRGLQLGVMTAPEFPLPLLGLVHVRQTIAWARPVAASEPLGGSCRVEGHRVARRGGEFDLVCAVTAGGEPVWTGVTTLLSRALPGDGVKRPRPPEAPIPPGRSACWEIPEDQGRRYAAVSGDWNPIHLHALAARLFGFARAVAHGWWLLARALAELDDDVPPAGTLDARFLAPVPLPSTVRFVSGRVGGGVRFAVIGREPCVVGEVRP